MFGRNAVSGFKWLSPCFYKQNQLNQYPHCTCNNQGGIPPIYIESVFDLATTLAQICILCGINECKAKRSTDIIVYFFLHYDQACYPSDPTPKKLLKKEELLTELSRRCRMNRAEANLAYRIIKRGFKAFYYEPTREECKRWKITCSEEGLYLNAAIKTVPDVALHKKLTPAEERDFEIKIKVAYRKFHQRMEKRLNSSANNNCVCCSCFKTRAHIPRPITVPCKSKNFDRDRCPHCLGMKKRRSTKQRCKDPLNPCTCGKKKFALNYVKSIWERPDMNLYFYETIMGLYGPGRIDPCEEWTDPSYLKHMAPKTQTKQAICAEWHDPTHLKPMKQDFVYYS